MQLLRIKLVNRLVVVHTFLIGQDSDIMIPIIDEPNLDSTYPVYAKYATTGATLGHEMGHSFDPAGIEWNEDGFYEKWLPKEDQEEYTKRVKCLTDQYDNYDDPDFGRNVGLGISGYTVPCRKVYSLAFFS